ncbi:phage tail tube protein [Neptuniibacter sp.]|uniref:phage tail tube protein n=1 Tax=Neptuniibacter sp. TaxID=1962643 RepID=UPI00261CBFB6|nr:phage tail tube protein [Neptuniibacter sp.]MCP4595760.1 hypothetical protein [Neptuniibacter sp.]
MLSRKKILLAKVESTYGTDATPAAADAILTKNLDITPYDGNTVQRDLVRPTLGNEEAINVAPNVKVSFEVEIAGSGAAGTAPAWGSVLRACGFSETVNAGTDVQYQPVSSSFESASLHYEQDGQIHKVLGCRGSVSFDLSSGGIPVMKFSFTGLYAKPVTGSLTADLSAFQVPLPVTKANTPTYTIHGYSAIANSFSVDMSNNVVHRNQIGHEEISITDRSPSGQMVIDAPTLTDKDMFALVESHNGITTDAVQVVHGTVAGNIVQIDAPKVQLSGISGTDLDGQYAYQLNTSFIPDAGDDEIVITVK